MDRASSACAGPHSRRCSGLRRGSIVDAVHHLVVLLRQSLSCDPALLLGVAILDPDPDFIVVFDVDVAVNMAKLVLKTVSTEKIEKAELFDMLLAVVNDQNFQIHEMKNYLGAHEGTLNITSLEFQ